MKNLISKQGQSSLLATLLSMILIGSTLTIGANLILNDSSNATDISAHSGNFIKDIDFEIWADTTLSLLFEDDISKILLKLDNGTAIEGQELEIYFNDSLISKEITDLNGSVIFNPSNESPGTYFVFFQGNSALYLNPSFITFGNLSEEKQIAKILTINTDKKFYFQNETIKIFGELINNYNELNLKIEFNDVSIYDANIIAINESYEHFLNAVFENEGNYYVFASSGNLSAQARFYFLNKNLINLNGSRCAEFSEQVLWSSGFSNDHESVKYQTWSPKYNCTSIGEENCFITNIKLYSRLISTDSPVSKDKGTGYVQISGLDDVTCNNPEIGNYSGYMAYDNFVGEGKKEGKYCKSGKDKECDLQNLDSVDLMTYSKCYGVKTYSSQYLLTDVFYADYTLCTDGRD